MAVPLLGRLRNFFIRPVGKKKRMTDQKHMSQHDDRVTVGADAATRDSLGLVGLLARFAVAIPFCIGLFIAPQGALI
jgi:hypothetical protein